MSNPIGKIYYISDSIFTKRMYNVAILDLTNNQMKILKRILKILGVLTIIGIIFAVFCFFSLAAYNNKNGTKLGSNSTKISDYIVDEANILSEEDKQKIIGMIEMSSTKSKIGIVTTETAEPFANEEYYAAQVINDWIKKKSFSKNGVILIFFTKNLNTVMQYGHGDSILLTREQGRKVLEIVTSSIGENNDSEAMIQGVKAIIDLSSGKDITIEPTTIPTKKTTSSNPTKQPLPVLNGGNIFSLVNQYRSSKGLPFLSVSDELCGMAGKRADLMMANNMEAFKKSSTGNHYQFDDVQYSGEGVGENVAANLAKDNDVVEKWKTSSAHNELMLWTEKEGTKITKGCVATRVSEVGSIVVLLVGDK